MIRAGLGCGLAALLMTASSAVAAEVEEKAEFAAEPAKVWAAIGDFCGIGSWHPAIEKCEVADAGGKKTRTLTLKGGGTIVEPLDSWDDKEMSYTYRITESPLPVENYTATIKVEDYGSGKSEVEWSAKFDPKGTSEDEAKKVISGIFEAGFEGLQGKLK